MEAASETMKSIRIKLADVFVESMICTFVIAI